MATRHALEENPPGLIGLATLTTMAFNGVDLAPIWSRLVNRVSENAQDAAALLDLSTIAQLQGRSRDGLALQARALALRCVFRQPPADNLNNPIRLLAFVAPGDFMANLPFQFMLESSNVTLDLVYLLTGQTLPRSLPEHDVALVAVSETSKNQPILCLLDSVARAWPRPIINIPAHIARLTRDGAWRLLQSAPGVLFPMNVRINRTNLACLARGELSIANFLGASDFPIVARPLDSHSGQGAAKLDDAEAVGNFLRSRQEEEFYIAPFVDYRGRDGQFRKYRIALIERRPYACHMAISEHWMVHYFNADMTKWANRRAEEAQFIANFDEDFANRHATALKAIAERVDLDYIPLDCGETTDGRLLVFEIGTNMIIHSMDPPDLFPYKRPQMERILGAFQAMLRNAGHRSPGIATAA
jgi:hypothetical protein